jgi:hypothetical protein
MTLIKLTPKQQKAYDRYIKARNRVRIGSYGKHLKGNWIPLSDVVCTVDIANMNHPLFEQNDEWIEYKAAFADWLAIEPEFRKTERMSMIRGDFGDGDTWREKQPKVKEIT